ncbi:MAG: xanthine dehydrogenase family protein molybdopterin-binding subunit [Halobacteriota archaeon]
MADSYSKYVGTPQIRTEDPPLLTGEVQYVDDISKPNQAHLAILRSQYAHARIEDIDTSAAATHDDVVAVYTADDIEASGVPGYLPARAPDFVDAAAMRPLLASDRVRFQGEPVAVVVAEDKYAANYALDAIEVSYDRLDAVTEVAEARADDAPSLHDDAPRNTAFEYEIGDGAAVEDAFEVAENVVELTLDNQRILPTAMEPRAAVASYKPADGRLQVEVTSQKPHKHQHALATTLGLPDHKVRVVIPAVGGGFGAKGHNFHSEALASWCSMQLGRPIKWVATRTEDFMTTSHARAQLSDAALAFDDDGTIQGLRVRSTVNLGGYLCDAAAIISTFVYAELLSEQYAIPALHATVTGGYTNTTPTDSYRGAGRPEACYIVERLVETAARELGIDPVEFRRRNLIPPDAFPYTTATGATYDSGDYEATMDRALDLVEYADLRADVVEDRDQGVYRGVGLASYVESTGSGPGNHESGVVRVKPSGTVMVFAGTHDHGQGHRTTYAQIVADELGVPLEDIEVHEGDTSMIPEGNGTSGSRSTVVGGSAVSESAETIREKARQIAAHNLEAAPADIELADGEFAVKGAPNRSISFREVAQQAYSSSELPEGMELGLEATTFYEPDSLAYTFGTHVAVVEVDVDSGELDLQRYVAVDDCGTQINPKLVEGQMHGGLTQGIGQALYEAASYDSNGTLVSGSLQDYAIPKAFDVPHYETDYTETPAPNNPLGAKGIGEAGTIASPPAVVNAVVDALEPFGIEHVDMPLTPERIWRTVDEARADD